jgi:AraC-like DNA-binding protein
MQAFDFSPLVDFAGVALGLLLALLLATGRRGNRAANRWLAGYVGSLALLSLGDFFADSRLVLDWPHLAHLTDWLIFLVGPFLWMYVQRLTMHADPGFRRGLLHCIPAFLCLLVLTAFYVLPQEQKQSIVAQEIAAGGSKLELPLIVAATQLLIYWGACLRTLWRFAAELRAQFSSLEKRTFAWLKWMLGVNFGMWLLWILGLSLQTAWAIWLDRLAIPIGFYLLAFLGMRQPAVFVGRSAIVVPVPESSGGTELPEPRNAAGMGAQRADSQAPRYARSGLDKERVPEFLARLEELVKTEKPWLENDLTLTQLSERLGISTHHLSQLLNDEIGMTFFDYINRLRVQEVQRCLADPAYRSQTILDIALASGFNSKAAFNAAFRLHAGMTPSEFRLQRRVA